MIFAFLYSQYIYYTALSIDNTSQQSDICAGLGFSLEILNSHPYYLSGFPTLLLIHPLSWASYGTVREYFVISNFEH